MFIKRIETSFGHLFLSPLFVQKFWPQRLAFGFSKHLAAMAEEVTPLMCNGRVTIEGEIYKINGKEVPEKDGSFSPVKF